MLLLTMANEATINDFLRKRFHAKEVYTVQMAVDFLHDHKIQAVVLSDQLGDNEFILNTVMTIRQVSPVKIIYIGQEVTEELGKVLMSAGVIILEGEFDQEELATLVQQYYNEDAVRRFAISEIAAGKGSDLRISSYVRQRIVSVVGAPGAGKSLFANSLARATGLSGAKTVVIDVANFPLQHVHFNIKNKFESKNISLYALDPKATLQEFLVEAGKNVWILPGAVATWGEVNISTTRMDKLIREAKEHFDVIIFDCSPFVTEAATHDAIKASRDVFAVTTSDLVGLHNATRLFPNLPEDYHWVQNRYIGTDLHQLYMNLVKRQSPVIKIPDIDTISLASAVAKGNSHPVMMKAAEEVAGKVLGIFKDKQKKGLLDRLGRRRGA